MILIPAWELHAALFVAVLVGGIAGVAGWIIGYNNALRSARRKG